MRYLSLFSGIEAASVAWGPLGWEPMAFAEVDPFPCAVLQERYPKVDNLGDVGGVDWFEFVRDRGRPDVLVGGSPCQSFSVAGSRTGLEGASGLMWEFVRAVRDVHPRWFVWENVPGALSSARGEDFGCLLRSMDDLGYGLAWRVLDAQFFGVAQRRRRVFLVGNLAAWGAERACQVLFEPEGLRWDNPSSRKKREALTADAQVRPGGCYSIQGNVIGRTLVTKSAGFSYHPSSSAGGIGYVEEQAPTVLAAKLPAVCTAGFSWDKGEKGGSIGYVDEQSPTLTTVNQPAVCTAGTQANSERCDDMAPVLTAHSAKDPHVLYEFEPPVVRRLTPMECERLQGFPDGWTDVTYNGKPAPDTRRYKALGNSMAVPVMRWIGERIERADALGEECL